MLTLALTCTEKKIGSGVFPSASNNAQEILTHISPQSPKQQGQIAGEKWRKQKRNRHVTHVPQELHTYTSFMCTPTIYEHMCLWDYCHFSKGLNKVLKDC